MDNDVLGGGTGSDFFGFLGSADDGIDTIKDFEITRDFIVVDVDPGTIFENTELTADNTIIFDRLHIGITAADASDRFIYDNTTGNLFFDADGIGSANQIQIATLEGNPALNYTHIYASKDQLPSNQVPGITSNNRADLY